MNAEMVRLVVGVVGKEGLRNFIEEREGTRISDARRDAEWDDLTKPGGPTLRARAEDHLSNISNLLPGMAELIYSRPWMISDFTRKTLVTSDHPVFLIRDPETPAWMGVGIANAYGIGLALSRHRGMIIFTGESESDPDGVVPGNTARARMLNMQIIQNAREAVYHHPDDDPVAWFGGTLPEPRTSEIQPGGDALIMPDEVGYPAPARDVPAEPGEDTSFSLADLQWPVEDRVFSWSEPLDDSL